MANNVPATAAKTAIANKSLMAKRFAGYFIFEWIKSGEIPLVKMRLSKTKGGCEAFRVFSSGTNPRQARSGA
jgi:hypothetical protein